jgi:hypothetical protein
MANYRYLFSDLLTNSVVAELDLTGVSFSQQLNSAGTFSGSIQLTGQALASNTIVGTIPGRTALYVDRDGVLVWGGVIWHREYNSKDQHIQLTAQEFESYFGRRRITTTQTYFNVDQLAVARGLITTAQSATSGNIGVQVGSEVSGINVAAIYRNYEQKTVLSALQDLAKSNTGFDFTIDVAYDTNGVPAKTLKLGYPRSGKVYSATNATCPVFEFPAGNVIEYSYPEDGSLVANTIYATGAGSSEGKLIYSASDSTKLNSGWPLLEDTVSYTDVIDGNLIQGLAAGQVAAVSYPPTTMKLVAYPSADPVFGSYKVGDDARVRIFDDRFPNGLDSVYRITALTVSPGETQGERVTLTLTLPNS